MLLALSLAMLVPTPIQTAAFGAGARTCETALASDHLASTFAWVMGYVSGINSATGAAVGQSTDGNGIMEEVRKACQQKPSTPLIEIVEDVYLQLQGAGR